MCACTALQHPLSESDENVVSQEHRRLGETQAGGMLRLMDWTQTAKGEPCVPGSDRAGGGGGEEQEDAGGGV